MSSFLRPFLAAVAVALAFFPAAGRAQNAGSNLENRVSRLDAVVSLTASQRSQALEIFGRETEALNALTPQERPLQGTEIRQNAMADIRALLTREQQKKYDLTPQAQGGSLTRMSPAAEVNRLDEFAQLTYEQKLAALKIFEEQIEGLMDIPPANRLMKGTDIRQGTRARVRALLSPEQQVKYDRTPQARGGGQNINPVNLQDRLDKVVQLNDDQVMKVAAIFLKMADDLQPISPEDRSGQRTEIRRNANAQIRALLTPEQQQKFDANPNGIEDLEQRAYVENALKSSPNIAARVGPVKRLSLVESSTMSVNNGPVSSGYFSFKVEGGSSTETVKVYWERPTPADQIKILKLVGNAGEMIQL